MATDKKTAVKETPVEEKLKALFDLQKVSTEIDKIRTLRGELPLEVQDLEDEIEGLQTRANNLSEEVQKLSDDIVSRKNEIKEADLQIKKYVGQQDSVRNNREYDAITKEIEYQELEKQLCEKRIKEHTADMEKKKEQLADAQELIKDRSIDLESKRKELETIVEETKEDIEVLEKKAKEISKNIDERLLSAFDRIRSGARNGLAVVTVQRDACGGCFNKIPPQRQLDIRLRKKIIVCEYCGRILVDDMDNNEAIDTTK
ncbi:MAG: C4-type zinc ribbon domain-containing protein [Bacteroidales bacterium]|nr:C4-type zinc ribbon domain-containing protein [Bacteroidales bacterium]